MNKRILVKEIDKLTSTLSPDKVDFEYITYLMVDGIKAEAYTAIGEEGLKNKLREIISKHFQDLTYTKNLEYGVYYIRQVDGESYDSFELKEIFPLKIKMVEKEKYYQGDKIKIAWNGRPELMYRVEVKSKTPVNKLVQGNLFEFSIQNTEEIEITITEQKFERSSTAKVSMSISKDLDIIGVQELDGAGVGIHQLQYVLYAYYFDM